MKAMTDETVNPLVSVVIPTRQRPLLVARAVESVLFQTYANLEVIVVIDGPDGATQKALGNFSDARLRVVALLRSVGGAAARNVGVQNATGAWIAFLDDDDEWLPERVERQLGVGLCSSHASPIISSRLIARSPTADYVWPVTVPFTPIADYLMQRKGLFQGDGLIQTSTLLMPSALMRMCPFNERLKKHQDWDWLIRAMSYDEVGIEFVSDPLVVWHIEEDRTSMSSSSDWRFSMEWLESIKTSCSARSYATFLLTVVSAAAANQKHWNAFFPILAKAFHNGSPKLEHVFLHCAMWIFPRRVRQSLRSLCAGHKLPRHLAKPC